MDAGGTPRLQLKDSNGGGEGYETPRSAKIGGPASQYQWIYFYALPSSSGEAGLGSVQEALNGKHKHLGGDFLVKKARRWARLTGSGGPILPNGTCP